ncbi:metal dependent phosphohydrolase [Rhodothermus marinus SG0.5JP17-172]|uniref:CRISPR-associated helicase/endonuclease Cas3 n=1 Tax=Rhodothermus marinus TaxID=29549 RepID=UPI000223DB44|nr:CRISPR-associated helicase/endonuclease Cas3 [Rhodothermus marinus]AEN73078.1 metal dependent phosphohydrolase [Rhodothermus marinus SG0.5JP17-172]
MLLAKPDVSLLDHLAEVTRLGATLADRLDFSESLRQKVILACALHDIGKATEDFQEYIRGRRRRAFPHALASLPFVLLAEGLLNQQQGTRHALEATAAVLTHHSPLGARLYLGYRGGRVTFHESLKECLTELWDLLAQYEVNGLPNIDDFWESLQGLLQSAPADLLESVLELGADRRSLRGLLRLQQVECFARVKAVLHLADWLASARKPDPGILFLQNGSRAIGQHTRQLEGPLRQFQEQAQHASNEAVLWLRAPTGTGKTEALLLWAGDTERLIYLLPTQATTNAMWRRLRRIYGDEAVALAHGRAAYMLRMELDEDPLDARLFGSVFARPVVVATLDQYLLAHLHGRHWEERRTLARRATVVLDEIHAYEPYTLGLLLEALWRELPARLALASATLPESLLQLFPEGHLVEAEEDLWQRRRHHVQLQQGSLLEEGMQQARDFARQGRRVLVVANTVADAQALYEQLQATGLPCTLLHARFAFRDRQHKEEQVARPQPGSIFIATQVVEVSLDISYDVLLTEVAPIDALVQRMGRVNRRGDNPPAPVLIYMDWSEGARRIYGQDVLERSLEILQTLPVEPTDAELAQATHQLYEYVLNTEAWRQEFQEGCQTLDELQRILGCYTIDLTDEQLRARFTTRRGMISVEVLPQCYVQEALQLKEQGEGWRLPELLVPVPVYWLVKAPDAFEDLADLQVRQTSLPYDAEHGLRLTDDWQTQLEASIL